MTPEPCCCALCEMNSLHTFRARRAQVTITRAPMKNRLRGPHGRHPYEKIGSGALMVAIPMKIKVIIEFRIQFITINLHGGSKP